MLKEKLTVDAFQATKSMPPSIPTPRIVLIHEGSPVMELDDLLEEPLIPLPLELVITQVVQQIISSISILIDPIKDKGKRIAIELESPMKSSKKSEGWSKE